MIVVIASEFDTENEIQTLHQLFDAGLVYYHLRKPNKTAQEYADFLDQIDEKYHKHIVLHQFHRLTDDFQLKGVHLQEQARIDLHDDLQNYVDDFKSKGFTVSSSFHHPDTISQCQVDFDYHLLSPIFSSISKQGYHGKDFSVNGINKKIIGMGGVTADNLDVIQQKGFQGAGVLGGVWRQDDNVGAFKTILENANF